MPALCRVKRIDGKQWRNGEHIGHALIDMVKRLNTYTKDARQQKAVLPGDDLRHDVSADNQLLEKSIEHQEHDNNDGNMCAQHGGGVVPALHVMSGRAIVRPIDANVANSRGEPGEQEQTHRNRYVEPTK